MKIFEVWCGGKVISKIASEGLIEADKTATTLYGHRKSGTVIVVPSTAKPQIKAFVKNASMVRPPNKCCK